MSVTTIFLAALLITPLAVLSRRNTSILPVFVASFLACSIIWLVLGTTSLDFAIRAIWIIVIFAGIAYLFRGFLTLVLPYQLGIQASKMPLSAAFGLITIVLYAICALFAPFLAPYGESQIVSTPFAFPSAEMPLGADQLGRDVFSRIIFGARNSISLALLATLLAFFGGALAGLLAAVRGGWVDLILSRLADAVMSIPSLIFCLLLLSIFGTGLPVIVVVVAIIYSPRVFRLTRAVARNVVVMDYVEAAKLRGEGNWYLIRREILPNVTAPLIAEFGLEFCFVFLLIAGLSFLGVGIQPPTADWGSMVRDNASMISFGDYTPLIPAAAIALLTVAINFVIDWLLQRSSGLKD